VELYQDEVARFVHQIELRASTNPIESLFATVHLSREFLKRDPIVSRAILLVLLTEADTDPQIRAGVVRPRVALLSSLIRHAQQSGAIQANVNAEHLGALIGRIFFSVLIDWAHDEISFKEMEAELNRSLLLLLRGACTPAQVRGLDRLLKRKRPK
jgi:hypothetical protein